MPWRKLNPEQITGPKLEAIHRALLTGLLGNIGAKTDVNEYTGARGTKFHLFPGSGLYKRSPKWVMAAELVETTRLYARTCARIQPEWVERLAEHVLTRTYTEPRWSHEQGQAVINEKVSLWGMVLVAARVVSLAPVDMKNAREIFIHFALVEGEYYTHAPFFQQNQKLIEEVRALEAKARKRDVLVPDQVRYAFYDSKLPPDVYSGTSFEQWRKQTERLNPRLLYMTRHDVMRHAASDVTEQLFPNHLIVNDVPLALQYDLDPGGPMDGVTAVVPLAVLNQLPTLIFEWLVPGLLREKLLELIKSLPKPIRVNFVPAGDTADTVFAALQADNVSLYEALAHYLQKASGSPITKNDFTPASLPAYLHMNFKIVDPRGQPLANGRDLNELRRKLGVVAKETFARMPKTGIERENLQRWDFGDLPDRVEVQRAGLTFYGYPALVDKHDSVSIEVLDSPAAARAATRGGVRRLFFLQVREDLRWVERNLAGIEQMQLNYATLGNYKDLKADLLIATADRAFFDDQTLPEVRSQAEFARRAQVGWKRLIPTSKEVCTLAGESLGEYQSLQRKLTAPVAPLLHPGVRDMLEQLGHLVFKGFIVHTPYVQFRQLPRYLKGMQIRLQKLTNAGLARDMQQLAIVQPLWRQYLDRLVKHRKEGVRDPELFTYRWMVEELRISLFAQELKTAGPISVQRVEKQWEKVKP